MRIGIGETLYGEHDETTDTLSEARGYLIVAPNGDHLAIIPGADEGFTETTEGARVARRIAHLLQTHGMGE